GWNVVLEQPVSNLDDQILKSMFLLLNHQDMHGKFQIKSIVEDLITQYVLP
ncbi:hypothetical protein ACJX0J_014502, partial [Zea mays]